ncbi:hypothetical protein QQX98_012192 [Neonectria punicea]|uniref:Uncharacterized protein n=1 Tax=Neonectria punicea TaxID=979145 RepID=A0ABR1GJK4_9HYPO
MVPSMSVTADDTCCHNSDPNGLQVNIMGAIPGHENAFGILSNNRESHADAIARYSELTGVTDFVVVYFPRGEHSQPSTEQATSGDTAPKGGRY